MHNHVWQIESKVTQESAWEQMTARGGQLKGLQATSGMFEQPVIVTYKCEICGSQKVERV